MTMDSAKHARAAREVNLDDDQRSMIIGSIVSCMILALITFLMRLASRRVKKSTFIVSDYLVACGLLCAYGVSAMMLWATALGLGLHIELVPPANIRLFFLSIFVVEIVYSIGFVLIKLSIMALYRQLFPTRFMFICTRFLGAFVIMWGVALTLVSIFSCNPIRGFWDLDIGAKCINTQWFFIGNSIPNILADICLLCLPMRDVWTLQLGLRSKIIISVLFALGSFVIVASGLRIHFTLNLDPSDIPWSYVDAEVWTAVEMNVAIMCCCLPTVRPIVTFLVPHSLKQAFSGVSASASSGKHEYKPQGSRPRHPLGSIDIDLPGSEGSDFIPLRSHKGSATTHEWATGMA
ncbi:hypothetical protein F5Y06DRAFT_305051 [Hypoxylon sp. FL0890]|nr:hypothetical protein F5Y06DRAFT_305051 [Hypoxylon sp. FL0890]